MRDHDGSFRRAQAAFDAMQPPDYDDRREVFDEAVREEAGRQIAGSADIGAELLAENINGADIRLMNDPAAFVARCKELIAQAGESFAGTIVDRVHDFCDRPQWQDSSVAEMVRHALNDHWYTPILGDQP
ncbi:MAG: hypothetical protein QG616_758 [Pseudomonadota bacterium]|nr:hypothetical protein [Pseudomonadota bacterium]